MMIRKTKEHENERVLLAVSSALQHPEMLGKLARHGYNEKTLQQAISMLEKVKVLDQQHYENLGIQKNATQQIREARQQANKTYMSHLKIAREALADRYVLWDVLKLKGARKKSLPGWLDQVKCFYYNYERVTDVLEKHNITPDVVEQMKAMIEAIDDYRVTQSLGRSNAQEATQQRKQASRELEKWMQEFFYIARFALKDKPQYLEALGKVVRG